MKLKFTLPFVVLIGLGACKDKELVSPKGNARLQIAEGKFERFNVPNGIKGVANVIIKTQSSTDTSSFFIDRLTDSFEVNTPDNFTLNFDYDLPERVKQMTVSIRMDAPDGHFKNLSIKQISFAKGGHVVYSEKDYVDAVDTNFVTLPTFDINF